MKIAICFSGQTRVGKYAVDNIRNFIGDCWDQTDFFVHTWNVNTFGTEGGIMGREPSQEYVHEHEILNLYSNYSPKKLVIDDFDKTFFEFELANKNRHSWQFVSWHRSVQLKTSYEIENNFEYDIVIKLRPDVIFHPTVKLSDLINYYISCNNRNLFISNFTWRDFTGKQTTDDILFLSNSSTMNVVSSWWENFTNTEKNVTVNMHLTDFILDSGLDIRNFNIDMNIMSDESLISLLRYETIQYDPITEFDQCMKTNLKLFFKKL